MTQLINSSMKSTQWDAYQRAALTGQIASGIVVVISVMALVIICGMHPNAAHSAAYIPSLITLSAVAGSSFLVFIISSCVQHIAMNKLKIEISNLKMKLALKQERVVRPIQQRVVIQEPTVQLEENPLKHVKEALLDPLIQAVEEALEAVVVLNCSLTADGKAKEKIEEVKEVFKEIRSLMDALLNDQHIFVRTLLSYYGPGKTEPDAALRRYIAAYNSQNTTFLDEAITEYEAILRGNDLSPIATALMHKSNAQLMQEFPDLLSNHFSFPNEELHQLGQTILKAIFANTEKNEHVLAALNNLRKQSNAEAPLFIQAVGNFIQFAHDQTLFDPVQYSEWTKALIEHMLHKEFKQTSRRILGLIARGIRIVEILFQKIENDAQRERIFVEIDTSFLLSESGDLITNFEMQHTVFELQSRINLNRKVNERIAFICVPKGAIAPVTLGIIQACKQANPQTRKPLSKEELASVRQLENESDVKLELVPISFFEHPIKQQKNNERTVKVVSWLVQGLSNIGIDPLSMFDFKGALLPLMPKMHEETLERFMKLIPRLTKLCTNFILNGAINETPFTRPFQQIVTQHGIKLAEGLEELVKEKSVTFKSIRDVSVPALTQVAQAFAEANP